MNMLIQQFEDRVACYASQPALIEDDREVSYRELHECVNRAVDALRQAGLDVCTRIALDGVNRIEFVAAYLAVTKIGACVIPIDSRLSISEVTSLLDDCEPNAYLLFGGDTPLAGCLAGKRMDLARFTMEGCDEHIGELLIEPKRRGKAAALPDDLVIQYSSGSTGLPKGIVLTATNIYHKVNNWNATLEITAGDVFLCTLTLSHCYGMYVHTLPALLAGARVYLPSLDTLTPGRIARLIGEHGITVFGSLPYMYQMLLALPPKRLPLATVRYLISGSAPLPEVTAIAFKEKFGRNINQVYGLTEIGLITFNKHSVDPMSLGELTLNMQARVMNEQGQECTPEEAGELVVRCESMARGYLNNPEDQQQMFRDGWLYTKDIVRRMPEGGFHMCGRISQFINVGGNKVSPVEIENALLTHVGVREAAVVARRHETTSEEIVAFVVPQDSASPPTIRELSAHCKTCLSAYKQPRDFRIIDALPKSPLGKVLKSQLFSNGQVVGIAEPQGWKNDENGC